MRSPIEVRLLPGPSATRNLENAGQLGEVRLRFELEDEVQYRIVGLVGYYAGNNAPVLGDQFALCQRIARIALGVLH